MWCKEMTSEKTKPEEIIGWIECRNDKGEVIKLPRTKESIELFKKYIGTLL